MSRKVSIGEWPRHDKQKAKPTLSFSKIIWLLRQIIWPDEQHLRRPVLLMAVLLILIVSRSMTFISPAIQGFIVDALNTQTNGQLGQQTGFWLTLPVILTIAYGGSRMVSNSLDGIADLAVDLFSLPAIRSITVRSFQHVLSLPIAYHLDAKAGTLSQGLKRGLASAENLANRILLTLGPVIYELIGATAVVLIWFGWFEALVIVFIAFGYVAITRIFDGKRNRLLQSVNKSEDRVNGTMIESLTHIESVKVFGAANRQLNETDAGLKDYQNASIRVSFHWLARTFAVSALLGVGFSVILVSAISEIQSGQRSVGDFVFLSGITIGLFRPIGILAMIGRRIQDDMVHTERLFTLLDEPNDLADQDSAKSLVVTHGAIQLNKLGLSYVSGAPIIRDLQLEMPAGSMTGIVGPTGAGKSSLIKLLFRLYRPEQGQILIDGQDIWQHKVQSLTDAMVLVPQDTVLLNDTIEANLRFARQDASLEDMNKALWVACINDFVERQAHGLQTLIGERGLKLSGGERQRMAIARAVLKNPKIYVFDEATSSLDSATETLVQERLETVTQGATRLVIAHRLSTIQDADQIAVMDQGQVVELGKHSGLLAQDGLYAKLWTKQSRD